MEIEFMSGVAVIASDPTKSRELFVDGLGLPLEPASADDDYFHTEKLPGSKHFGVWPLSQAAQACFGTDEWPDGVRVPQASIEFEVAGHEQVGAAAEELRDAGYELIHDARQEPWGQTVARVLSADGLVIGVSYAPWLH